jgi:hypothetical protein
LQLQLWIQLHPLQALLVNASLHVRRAKNGKPSVHPLRGDELRALRELQRQFPDSAFVFATERGFCFART